MANRSSLENPETACNSDLRGRFEETDRRNRTVLQTVPQTVLHAVVLPVPTVAAVPPVDAAAVAVVPVAVVPVAVVPVVEVAVVLMLTFS